MQTITVRFEIAKSADLAGVASKLKNLATDCSLHFEEGNHLSGRGPIRNAGGLAVGTWELTLHNTNRPR